MQKCADSGFCERLRGKQGDVYSVDAKSVAINGAVVTAKVQHDASGAAYDLQLTNHNGILRMHIDEAASKHRFQVPWVLQSELPDSNQVSRAFPSFAACHLVNIIRPPESGISRAQANLTFACHTSHDQHTTAEVSFKALMLLYA